MIRNLNDSYSDYEYLFIFIGFIKYLGYNKPVSHHE